MQGTLVPRAPDCHVMSKDSEMKKEQIAEFILSEYEGVISVAAWGEQSFFYNPGKQLPRGVYFATLKDQDGKNDKASNLNRQDVFRFNFGVSKATYERNLGARPARPSAGEVVNTGHDFTRLNSLLPHPVYAWMSWVSVLNPDNEMFHNISVLLNESYSLAVKKFASRISS